MAIRTNLQDQRKVTFLLPVALMQEVRQLIEAGLAPSQSAFVAEAVTKEIHTRRLAALREEFRQAAADPDFLNSIEDTMRDFAAADGETARMIP
jgi:Arc/MetJ-type ribon-helix-helix transcriptional regulator